MPRDFRHLLGKAVTLDHGNARARGTPAKPAIPAHTEKRMVLRCDQSAETVSS